MMMSTLVIALSLLALEVAAQDDNNRLYSQICLDPDAKHVPGEFFRDARVSGSGDCRSVVSCSNGGLSYLRCPTGLHFDIEEQTCQWAGDVDNCDVYERNHTALPDLDESKCGGKNLSQPMFSCADGTCLPKTKLCDGKKDCDDGSDESACDANEANHARPCDVEKCRLPKCFCSPSGKEIPGGLKKDEVPQMVILTFDDAVNIGNQQTFEEIFNKGRKNANGCDIKATFFVSHKYTNYSMVHELHRRGHDISVHSISHNNEPSFWTRGTVDDWSKEVLGHKFIIEEFGKIPSNDIPGARAPLLRVGGNSQYEVMKAGQFQYDSTMTALYQDVPYWPYTLDHSIPHKCHGNVQKCPTKSFPGLWSMVMNEFDGSGILNENERSPLTSSCAMVDSCNIQDAEQFYNALTLNFMRHYESNRAPLGIYMHAAWLIGHPEMFEALLHWLDQVTEDFPDAYVVSMSQAVEWMKNPTPLSSIANFGPWKKKCSEKDWPKSSCSKTKACLLKSAVHEPGEVHKLISCADYCPATYPWTNDFLGRSSLKP